MVDVIFTPMQPILFSKYQLPPALAGGMKLE
jgi:hypothetical protein